MSKSFETQGIIHSIGQTTEYGNNGFTKREFVIKVTGNDENEAYPNYLALELVKDKCASMDSYSLGDEIEVHFNLTGRLWAGNGKGEKCFVNLQAWKVDKLNTSSPKQLGDDIPPYTEQDIANPYITQTSPGSDSFDDDIPF